MDTTKAEFKASYGLSSQLPERDRAEIVFSGRSNAGKSSLINKLLTDKFCSTDVKTSGRLACHDHFCMIVQLSGYDQLLLVST